LGDGLHGSLKKQIESRVQFEIDSQFRQEGIIIAFPQRDLHFDTDKPLNIQMTGQSPGITPGEVAE
jgi:small-conductance mechanosensitive channel